jgi:hypothetical protein
MAVAARAITAATAIEQWEKAHGRIFDKPIRISCPNCAGEAALKFARSQHHLYFECTTADCLPIVRGNYRK